MARPAQWTRLMDGQEPQAPAPRSGHALALLAPTQSVLVFGGSNGKVFFDDFHVLEPAPYASPAGRQAKQKAKAKMRRGTASERLSQQSQASQRDDERLPALLWKKLVVSIAPDKTGGAVYDAAFLANSLGSDASSESPRGVLPGATPPGSARKSAVAAHDPHLGNGRDYHTMHYVASPDEKQLGLRVLIVGNSVMSPVDDDHQGRGASQQPPVFDMDVMRIDEVRVKQPQQTAQWITRTVKSMWMPRARNGHCSALLGDQLFCFGGKNAAISAFYNDFFYFDVGLNQWREQASNGSIPSPRAFADMAASRTHEQLFVYGGHDSKRQFGGMFMYDVRHSRWDKILSLGEKPETRINHSLTLVSPDHLVLFGGRKRTSRRNDAYLYDIATMTWKQLGAQTSGRRDHATETESESQATAHQQQVVLTQSSVSSAVATTPKDYPSGRTAHKAVLFEAAGATNSSERSKNGKILVFGGYSGAHTWLNDLYLLEVDLSAALGVVKPGEDDRSASSWELTSSRVLHSSASNSSQSTVRSSSRSSIEGALLDITNTASSQQSTAGGDTATETVVAPTTTYTPAAVAARRRRLAEMESKRQSQKTPPKKQRTHQSTEGTSASQSEAQSDSAREHGAPSQSSMPEVSTGESIGLQTTMIQLLQRQQQMEHSISRLTSAVREGQSLAHRDAFTTHQVFMQKQNESLENKLEAMTKRYEATEKKVQVLEHDKQALQEQLVAAETEIYVYKKNMEEMIPKLSTRVMEAVEKATRTQSNSSHMIEAKISSIQDILEDIRHLSGERTETDDSPPKKSIFSDDSFSPQSSQRRTHTPAALYPQTVVRDLENKLHDVVEENTLLHQRIAVMEDKLKKAEGNAQRIQELSTAWLRYQEQEEEVKGE